MIDITIEGLDSLEREWAKAVDRMVGDTRGVVEQVSKRTANYMRTAHRYQDRTTDLSKSCHATLNEMTRWGASWHVRWSAPHAVFVDRGTRPHEIHGSPWLAFEWPKAGPGVHFFRSVHHPGTKSYALRFDASVWATLALRFAMDDAAGKAFVRWRS